MTLVTANINSLWASLVVEELVRLGVTQFIISPGSRSTPLVVAVANNERAQSVVHFDERGAAYFALGYARATGKPAALICTSGTAVANYLPAVVEASLDMVPLIILTADRPPELLDTCSNQTITQPGIFSGYVRWQFGFPTPSNDMSPEFILTTIDQAVYRAISSPSGPVHLNFMFREPLAPTEVKGSFTYYLHNVSYWHGTETPYTSYAAASSLPTEDKLEAVVNELHDSTRGLLVVGHLRTERERQAVAAMADRLGWPMFADIASGLRGGDHRATVDHFDFVLSSKRFVEHHQPQTVLQLGARLTSKRLIEFLKEVAPARYILVANYPLRVDPTHQVTDRIQCDIAAICEAIAARIEERSPSEWFADWRLSSQSAGKTIEKSVDSAKSFTEAAVARLVATQIAEDSALFLASSMPIRDMNQFAPSAGFRVPVGSNRGASGIDGTIASAAGFAHGLGRSVTLLVGDLAMLHDLNSLALVRQSGIKLTIIVMNNNGGGVFGYLPVAGFEEIFEKYFVTPHGLNFQQAAAMFDIPYLQADSSHTFTTAYRNAQSSSATTIIEILIDRATNQKFHTDLMSDFARRLDSD